MTVSWKKAQAKALQESRMQAEQVSAQKANSNNEHWLHQPQTRTSLERAMIHADKHPPQTTSLKEIEQLKETEA